MRDLIFSSAGGKNALTAEEIDYIAKSVYISAVVNTSANEDSNGIDFKESQARNLIKDYAKKAIRLYRKPTAKPKPKPKAIDEATKKPADSAKSEIIKKLYEIHNAALVTKAISAKFYAYRDFEGTLSQEELKAVLGGLDRDPSAYVQTIPQLKKYLMTGSIVDDVANNDCNPSKIFSKLSGFSRHALDDQRKYRKNLTLEERYIYTHFSEFRDLEEKQAYARVKKLYAEAQRLDLVKMFEEKDAAEAAEIEKAKNEENRKKWEEQIACYKR